MCNPMATAKIEGTPRERLLAAADELFYAHGVRTVGIDRVIERAGVAKASLYSTFGSKEELVRAYLEARGQRRRDRILQRIGRHPEAREKILSVFELLEEIAAEPGFRGCAFVNASAEEPLRAGPVRDACSRARSWVLQLFTDLARELATPDPERLGRQLAMLYDATVVAASMDREPKVAREARHMAQLLIDADPVSARESDTRRTSRRPSREAAGETFRKR